MYCTLHANTLYTYLFVLYFRRRHDSMNEFRKSSVFFLLIWYCIPCMKLCLFRMSQYISKGITSWKCQRNTMFRGRRKYCTSYENKCFMQMHSICLTFLPWAAWCMRSSVRRKIVENQKCRYVRRNACHTNSLSTIISRTWAMHRECRK